MVYTAIREDECFTDLVIVAGHGNHKVIDA